MKKSYLESLCKTGVLVRGWHDTWQFALPDDSLMVQYRRPASRYRTLPLTDEILSFDPLPWVDAEEDALEEDVAPEKHETPDP